MPSRKFVDGARTERHPLEVREKAFTLYRAGRTLQEIHQVLSVPVSTIQKWSSRGKWAARAGASKQERDKVAAANGGAMPDPPRDSRLDVAGDDLSFAEKQTAYRDKMSVQAMRLPGLMERMSDEDLVRNAEKLAKLGAEARKSLNLEDTKPSIVVNVGLLARATKKVALLAQTEPVPALPDAAPNEDAIDVEVEPAD